MGHTWMPIDTYRFARHSSGMTIKPQQRKFQSAINADGAKLRLVIEACRISYAHLFDPYAGIHSSLIQPLPHQITAVYEEMLPRQPLRFLLADDPGAGKTIMTGLLVKELIARGALERCLVIAPGNLVEQWQDEFREKFSLEFSIMKPVSDKDSGGRNPFDESDLLIGRLDTLARNPPLLKTLENAKEWDLVVCDEAHRMSATYAGKEVKQTKRYALGKSLGRICHNFLLLSATPHNGKEDDFQLFMALLDQDRFTGRLRAGKSGSSPSDLMRRLTKEELLRFDGRPLFPERRAYTASYVLSKQEAELYGQVTDYVRTEMNRAKKFEDTDKKKHGNVSFALQILQRRLASSPAAIHRSLSRRRSRLTDQLSLLNKNSGVPAAEFPKKVFPAESFDEFDELPQGELDDIEDIYCSSSTAALTAGELNAELKTLKRLEGLAQRVLLSDQDTKWVELRRILKDDMLRDAEGHRRKLIVFTEARDTLEYLQEKISNYLGMPDAVAVIHGGVTRSVRREIIQRFMQDQSLIVLLANDAAGEGVNLQRANLMVNYDLPWNPNRIEQRFGRIHRIGQTEVCHLWNLVASDTREGEVYGRLLEKLETARESLGGQVYDVLGQLFEEKPLKDLLFDAIRNSGKSKTASCQINTVDTIADRRRIEKVIETYALTDDALPGAKVQELRREMMEAEARRLQPCHVESFFVAAFEELGGRIQEREPARWEITYVPIDVRNRGTNSKTGKPVQRRYERICFDKKLMDMQPVAEFVFLGHPLLQSVIELVGEAHGDIMQSGAIMIDSSSDDREVSLVYFIEHSIADGCEGKDRLPNCISKRLQFARVSKGNRISDVGIAPHLNLRPATSREISQLRPHLGAAWISPSLELAAAKWVADNLGSSHLDAVLAIREKEIRKTRKEVVNRLDREMSYWDQRAMELKEAEGEGKKSKLGWQVARRRADEFLERKRKRLDKLENLLAIKALDPRVLGRMLVVSSGLLEHEDADVAPTAAGEHSRSVDLEAKRRTELAAMEAVMKAEQELGNEPKDVSADKVGYDICSWSPRNEQFRFIEVKGRAMGADSVTLTRQEIITSLHEPKRFILAIVEVDGSDPKGPRYIRGPLSEHQPSFAQESVTYNLKKLLSRASDPK